MKQAQKHAENIIRFSHDGGVTLRKVGELSGKNIVVFDGGALGIEREPLTYYPLTDYERRRWQNSMMCDLP